MLGSKLSDLATTGSTRHVTGSSSSSFKYSSNSKNQSSDSFAVRGNWQGSSGGSEVTDLVVESKANGNEAKNSSADFQAGIDMLSNSIDELHQTEARQSEASLWQSGTEEVHGEAVTQNEESDGTKQDLFGGGGMVSGIKSENNSLTISSEEQTTTSTESAEGTIP